MKTLQQMIEDQHAEMSALERRIDQIAGSGAAKTFKTKLAENLISHNARLLGRRPDKLQKTVERLRAGDLNSWELRVPLLEELARLSMEKSQSSFRPADPARSASILAAPSPAPEATGLLQKWKKLTEEDPQVAAEFWAAHSEALCQEHGEAQRQARADVRARREAGTLEMQKRSKKLE